MDTLFLLDGCEGWVIWKVLCETYPKFPQNAPESQEFWSEFWKQRPIWQVFGYVGIKYHDPMLRLACGPLTMSNPMQRLWQEWVNRS